MRAKTKNVVLEIIKIAIKEPNNLYAAKCTEKIYGSSLSNNHVSVSRALHYLVKKNILEVDHEDHWPARKYYRLVK